MRKIRYMIALCSLLLFCLSMTVSAHEHEGHNFKISYKKYVNETYHETHYYCDTCKQSFTMLEKHVVSSPKWSKDEEGQWIYKYFCCDETIDTVYLKRVEVYKNSANLKAVLRGNIYKGDILEIKIGSKTYRKKISKNEKNPAISLKIKKVKKNYKIKTWITRAGERLYLGSNYVKTSKHPKKGMTKKQVRKYTFWEDEPIVGYHSDGSEYWCYKDSEDYIVFKNGKVVKWFYLEPFFE